MSTPEATSPSAAATPARDTFMAPHIERTSSRPHFRDEDSHDEDQNEKLIADASPLVELGLRAPVGDVDSNRQGEQTRRHGHRPDPGAKSAADRYDDAQEDQGQAVHTVEEALNPPTRPQHRFRVGKASRLLGARCVDPCVDRLLECNSVHGLHNGAGSRGRHRSSTGECSQVRTLMAQRAGQHEQSGETEKDGRELHEMAATHAPLSA